MAKGIIFDLDQTIINSSIAFDLRKGRNWKEVYKLIPDFILFGGFDKVFDKIRNLNVRVCVVTNSPGIYAKKVINYHNIPCQFIVDYFATPKRKPHPDPMLKAIQLLCLKPDEVISFGDSPSDIISSNNAKIKSVACTWGNQNNSELLNSNPTLVLNRPIEILNLI